MIMKVSPHSNSKKFEQIKNEIESFHSLESKESGMIYTDNWYDSHPRMLILDPVLNPYDKVVWLVIRSLCTPGNSVSVFPTYDKIQSSLQISRGSVATAITKLRLTRWITLVRRERVRNTAGRIVRYGNIYLIHGEPVTLADTFEFDSNYMLFVHECVNHRNTEARKVANTIVSTFKFEADEGGNFMHDKHPFERRSEAWEKVAGNTDSRFYSYHPKSLNKAYIENEPSKSELPSDDKSTVVHEKNYGVLESSVHGVNQDSSRELRKLVSSSNNENYNYQLTNHSSVKFDELEFPKSFSSNQKHLAIICLNRLPSDLPQPPEPWSQWEQVLLDELSGRIEIGESGRCPAVLNAVSLLFTYCKRLSEKGYGLKDDGMFQIELAESVHRKRTKRAHSKRLFEVAQENHRRRMEQLSKKDL